MRKNLNESGIQNELRGQSAFFPKSPSGANSVPEQHAEKSLLEQNSMQQPGTSFQSPPHTEQGASTRVTSNTSKHASTLAGYQKALIEVIRKTVKDPGKEVTFVRLTLEEKRQLADITYTYKRQGIKTSENEIGRIAMSYLLEDYKANGQASLLAKVIAALRA